MASEWLSIKEAAERLGLSARSVERKISAGLLESKLSDGRRLVRTDSGPTVADSYADRLSEAKENADRQLQVAGAALGQARDLSEHLTGELKSAQRSARWAWGLVLLLILAGAGGLWWGTRTVMGLETRLTVQEITAQAQADKLSVRLAGAESEASQARQALQERADTAEALTDTLTVAQGEIHRLEAEKARVEGELTAAKAQARPSLWELFGRAAKP